MADHGGGEGGLGAGFIVLFFGAIALFWLLTGAGEGGGLFHAASSTPETTTEHTEREPGYYSTESYEETEQIGSRLFAISDEVRALRGEVDEAKLWGVLSPYADDITLEAGDVVTKDEDQEYLYLRNQGTSPISLLGWSIESYVSGERAHLPLGTALPRSGRVNEVSAIILEPQDSAIVVSGESPTGTSFRENRCTGYFGQHQDFVPALQEQCPYPLTEMEEYGNIDLDDDSCYRFVGTLRSCHTARGDARDARISASCEAFVVDELTYQGCVRNHQFDADFTTGSWRVYLAEESELWRKEREIIRLLDREGRTVDVLRY